MSSNSYLSSNLSDPKYSYDLVVGVTERSINATMKEFLYKYQDSGSSKPVEAWYKSSDDPGDDGLHEMDPIAGFDPFAIESGVYKAEQGPLSDAILDSDFSFAIRTTMGLPRGLDPSRIPDIVRLDQGSDKVSYFLFFQDFELAYLEWKRHGYVYHRLTQNPGDDPFVFHCHVDLRFGEAGSNTKYDNLPEEVQKALKNLDPNTMFSVQQLYLDLNSVGLQDLPTLSGIPTDSGVQSQLNQYFQSYWDALGGGDGSAKFTLGYAAIDRSAPDPNKPSIQPTSLDFMVVPYHPQAGEDPDAGSATLNYLMNSENRPLKRGGEFAWNWVDQSDVGDFSGAMAVSRTRFAEHLGRLLSGTLQPLCYTADAYFSIKDLGLSAKAGINFSPSTSPPTSKVSPTGSEILTLSFESHDRDSDKVGLQSGSLDATYNLDADVSLSEREISFHARAALEFDLDWDLGKGDSKGTAGGSEMTATFVVSVGPGGALSVKLKEEPKITEVPKSVSEGAFASVDHVTDFVNALNEGIKELTAGMAQLGTDIEKMLNSSGNKWIFPGGRTFLFKNAAFSNSQDLVVHIIYADPVV